MPTSGDVSKGRYNHRGLPFRHIVLSLPVSEILIGINIDQLITNFLAVANIHSDIYGNCEKGALTVFVRTRGLSYLSIPSHHFPSRWGRRDNKVPYYTYVLVCTPSSHDSPAFIGNGINDGQPLRYSREYIIYIKHVSCPAAVVTL